MAAESSLPMGMQPHIERPSSPCTTFHSLPSTTRVSDGSQSHQPLGQVPEALEPPSLWDLVHWRTAQTWRGLEQVGDTVKTYSKETIHGWNEQIKATLIFTGLLSAILSPLVVDAYSRLESHPSEPSTAVLAQTSLTCSSDSPHAILATEASPDTRPGWVVGLNALWISSLFFSLAATSLGVTFQQWLTIYSQGLTTKSHEAGLIQQHRLNNLRTWRVEGLVIFLLPTCVQLALFLFFAGLLLLLWNLNIVVASVLSVLVAALTMFTISTPFFPMVWSECCYLSPHALYLSAAMRRIGAWLGPERLRSRFPSNWREAEQRRIVDPEVRKGLWIALAKEAYNIDSRILTDFIPDALLGQFDEALDTVRELRAAYLQWIPDGDAAAWHDLLERCPPLHCSIILVLTLALDPDGAGATTLQAEQRAAVEGPEGLLQDLEGGASLRYYESLSAERTRYLISVYASVVAHTTNERLSTVALEALWWSVEAYVRSPSVSTASSKQDLAEIMAYLVYVADRTPDGEQETREGVVSGGNLHAARRYLHRTAVLCVSAALGDPERRDGGRLAGEVERMLNRALEITETSQTAFADGACARTIRRVLNFATDPRFAPQFAPFSAAIKSLYDASNRRSSHVRSSRSASPMPVPSHVRPPTPVSVHSSPPTPTGDALRGRPPREFFGYVPPPHFYYGAHTSPTGLRAAPFYYQPGAESCAPQAPPRWLWGTSRPRTPPPPEFYQPLSPLPEAAEMDEPAFRPHVPMVSASTADPLLAIRSPGTSSAYANVSLHRAAGSWRRLWNPQERGQRRANGDPWPPSR